MNLKAAERYGWRPQVFVVGMLNCGCADEPDSR
jgi:hypothetical protein